MGSSFETDYTALGPAGIAYLVADINKFGVGGDFQGTHIGAQGGTLEGANNWGIVGVVFPGTPVPAYGSGGIGVWGNAKNGPGVAGTSTLDSGVIGQNGDVFVIGPTAGVVGSSQSNSGVSGVSSTGNGVSGGSDSSVGVFGHSNRSTAVLGIAGQGFGFTGRSGVGVLGVSGAGGPQFADAPAGVIGTSVGDHGVRGTSSDSSGVVGISGAASTIALHDPNNSAANPPAGVFGTTTNVVAVGGVSVNSTGVLGQSGAPPTSYTQIRAGVFGASRDLAGVYGASDNNAGVLGSSKSTGVVGVCGNGVGVFGLADGAGIGVQGFSNSAFGVYGHSHARYGVFGGSETSNGVYGYSISLGPSLPSTIDPLAGVLGTSADHPGVLGTSTNLAGVVGYSKNQIGVYGQSDGTTGNAYAGFFDGNLKVTNQIFALVKNAIVPFNDGSHRLMHCMESPEHWFEDFGAAQLKRGRAVVKLDADFAKTFKTGDYRVFLTPEGDCGGLYIKGKRGDGFEVRELQGGTSNVAFAYRIVGRRRDIKGHKRFAKIDITPPMQLRKGRSVARTPLRSEVLTRKFRAALEKHPAVLATKSARGRKAS